MRDEPAAGDTGSIQRVRGACRGPSSSANPGGGLLRAARTRLPGHAIELDRPMVSFGLDSLMAIQLEAGNCSISIVKLLEGLTVAQRPAESTRLCPATTTGPN